MVEYNEKFHFNNIHVHYCRQVYIVQNQIKIGRLNQEFIKMNLCLLSLTTIK